MAVLYGLTDRYLRVQREGERERGGCEGNREGEREGENEREGDGEGDREREGGERGRGGGEREGFMLSQPLSHKNTKTRFIRSSLNLSHE